MASSHAMTSALQPHTDPHDMQGLYGVGAAGALGLALTQVILPSYINSSFPMVSQSQQTVVASLHVLRWICLTAAWAGSAALCS